jgi:hypothetical protein
MRTALQLLGGVAVAGAVAAGSTAFTGAGLTNSITGQKSFLGGTIGHTIVGASLDSLAFTTVDTSGVGGTKVTAFTLDFDANTPSGSTVTITGITGTPGMASGAAPDNFYCAALSTAGGTSVCTAGTAVGTYNGYFTGVGTFNITVV